MHFVVKAIHLQLMVTSDAIIRIVCEALSLDRENVVPKKILNKRCTPDKHGLARQMIVRLIRNQVKVQYPEKFKNLKNETRNPTYKQIAELFNVSHKTTLYWELECRIRLKDQKQIEFIEQYEKCVRALFKEFDLGVKNTNSQVSYNQ